MRRFRKFGWMLAACLFLLGGRRADASLTRISVEQVRVFYPYTAVYYYGEEAFTAQAWLNDASLTAEDAEGVDYGTSYYVLLDTSRSISEEDMEAAKEQIAGMTEGLSSEDSLTLITFGDEVQTLFSGTDAEAAAEALEDVGAVDDRTHLYLALKEALNLSQAEDNGLRRQILIVVSDGADTSIDDVSLTEVLNELESADIPLYAMCTQNASTEDREEFGSFARQTGGTFTVFGSDDAQEQWDALQETLDGCNMLLFSASAEEDVPTGESTFLLKTTTEGVTEDYSCTVSVTGWEADTEAPTVVSVSYDEQENVLTVVFSEAVLGADEISSYQVILSDGNEAAIWNIAKEADDSYCLYLKEVPAAGSASLIISGITDSSMEKNALLTTEIAFECPQTEEEPEETFPVWIVILCVLAAVEVLIVVILVLVLRKKKEPEPEPVPQPQHVETTVRHVVEHVQGGTGIQADASASSALTVSMLNRAGKVTRMELPVNRSAIMGRTARLCEICVEDPRVSGQHCVLEEGTDGIYVRDLHSRNGVFVNEILLQPEARCRLRVKDRLRIGDTVFQVENIRLRGKGATST
ncbi:MAG: VWA domain-containing protein [Lachnospiraceae bacterium]|nr:VWA domain-containing protein [Lachnospiraceae bacterium]